MSATRQNHINLDPVQFVTTNAQARECEAYQRGLEDFAARQRRRLEEATAAGQSPRIDYAVDPDNFLVES